MLNTQQQPITFWHVLMSLWQRLITSQAHPPVIHQQPDLTLYGQRYPQASGIGRRFPITPERAATMYRAADEAF